MDNPYDGNYDYDINYALIGDTAVGKTQLILRFIGEEFNKHPPQTVGFDYVRKKLKIER